MCETCLYNQNCQFLAKHPKTIVDGCTAYKDATNMVEVVRCKDCKHFHESKEFEDEYYCGFHGEEDEAEVFPDGYCSHGKRKEQT